MKKTSLLTMATAAAIVATTAGTFAVWDHLEETAVGTINVRGTSVVVQAVNIDSFTATENTSSIDYTGDVGFNVTGEASQLKLTPTVTKSDGTAIASGYSVSLEQTGDNAFDGSVDKNVEATNTYKVKVTVTDSSLNGQDLKVSVLGEATPKEK